MAADATSPKVIFTAGSPGAGKGYVLASLHPSLPVVDCDKHKEAHPDYDPKNPGALHAYSSAAASREFAEMLGKGETFVYDGTGANVEKMVQMINAAHGAGFETEILYVKVRLATALRRNAGRERVVPEELVREKFTLLATAIEILSGYAGRIVTVNND